MAGARAAFLPLEGLSSRQEALAQVGQTRASIGLPLDQFEAMDAPLHQTGAVKLDVLHEMADDEAEQFLTSLPGVGIKVAKCVQLYSLSKNVFPVDTHCFRVGSRLGWFPASMPRTAKNLRQSE